MIVTIDGDDSRWDMRREGPIIIFQGTLLGSVRHSSDFMASGWVQYWSTHSLGY